MDNEREGGREGRSEKKKKKGKKYLHLPAPQASQNKHTSTNQQSK